MSSVAFVLAGLGVIFIWAGVRREDPRDLFADAFRPGGGLGKGLGKADKADTTGIGKGIGKATKASTADEMRAAAARKRKAAGR